MPTTEPACAGDDHLSRIQALTLRCRDLCHRAVRTLAVLPDRELNWLKRVGGGQPAPVLTIDDVWVEFGPESAMALRKHLRDEQERRAQRYFRPTPEDVSRCLPVLGWLSWLERERNGRNERRIITARAFEVPYRAIARRFGRSDDTIRRWEAGGLAILVHQYRAEIEAMR